LIEETRYGRFEELLIRVRKVVKLEYNGKETPLWQCKIVLKTQKGFKQKTTALGASKKEAKNLALFNLKKTLDV